LKVTNCNCNCKL